MILSLLLNNRTFILVLKCFNSERYDRFIRVCHLISIHCKLRGEIAVLEILSQNSDADISVPNKIVSDSRLRVLRD